MWYPQTAIVGYGWAQVVKISHLKKNLQGNGKFALKMGVAPSFDFEMDTN
jgi:hypothetical protein